MTAVLFQEGELQTIITSRMTVTQFDYVSGRMSLDLATKWSLPGCMQLPATQHECWLLTTFSFVAGFTWSNPIPRPNRFGRDGSPGPSEPPGLSLERHLMEVV
jgi:hypothetical protein